MLGTENATSETFKKFRDWLDSTYAAGSPRSEEWETILHDDEEYQYQNAVEYQYQDANPVNSSPVHSYNEE